MKLNMFIHVVKPEQSEVGIRREGEGREGEGREVKGESGGGRAGDGREIKVQ